MKTPEELEEEYRNYYLDNCAIANSWISVKENLPKKDGLYLVLAIEAGYQDEDPFKYNYRYPEPVVAEFKKGMFYVDTAFISGRDYDVDKITAIYWKSLPPDPIK